MDNSNVLLLRNGSAAPIDSIPDLDFDVFHEELIQRVENGAVPAAYFSTGAVDSGGFRLYAVLVNPHVGTMRILTTIAPQIYPSITPDAPAFHMFERELAESWGILPKGHPWLKPVRFISHGQERPELFHYAEDGEVLPCVTNFYRMTGDEVHEVAVGPVHAGIIEPGHFRFQCHGETVYNLEISHGFQHRGIEKAILQRPQRLTHYMETLAGDTTVGHSMACCQNIEALSDVTVPARAEAIRAIGLELERLANHTGDLGALAGDVGFLPTASFCGRLRGDFLNMTALLCGSRFGRGLVVRSGVGFDADTERLERLETMLETTMKDVRDAVSLLWTTSSVMGRFEGTGTVSFEDATALGLVGPCARAVGIDLDVRTHFPTGAYSYNIIPAVTWHTGDVFARAFVRWLEIERSYVLINNLMKTIPISPFRTVVGKARPDSIAVSLVEGWRGMICHVALTDADGVFASYRIVDPSFHNWPGLELALRDGQISDFPLCNKSFNLSYCGFDL